MQCACTIYTPGQGLDTEAVAAEGIRDATLDQDGYILGTMTLFGVHHHVNIFRVRDGDDGMEADSTDDDVASMLDDMFGTYDQPWQTVEIPGIAGRWVIVMHPYG